MAITTLDQLIAAPKQKISYTKTGARASIAGVVFAVFDQAGSPSAGVLAVGNTTTGIVPTDSIAGYPPINTFAGGTTGYLSGVQFASTVASRITIYDCLFSAGAFAFNAAVTLNTQPSYSARVPDGTDFNGLELWVEAVTAFTGNLTIAVTYTNQSGVAARTTGTIATGVAPTIGRMVQLPLQVGDTGIQKIESITSTVATVGTFNVHVMRRLWTGRVRSSNDGGTNDFLSTGLPQVFDTSALRIVVAADSTSTGIPDLQFDIASG
jgi:hypothetical protein